MEFLMKKIAKSIKLFALLLACMAIPTLSKAQVVDNMYFNLNWQVNSPINNNFADKTSGWGAEGEFGWFVAPNFTVGAFLSYHKNNKYIPTTTMASGTQAITSDQQHCLYQLPYGLTGRYIVNPDAIVQPYIGLKLGPQYTKTTSYMNILEPYDESWGFYVSPEVGMTIYFTPQKTVGANLSFYYSYATNENKLLIYKEDGFNNWGFRVGLAF